jgi:carboxylesterase type B
MLPTILSLCLLPLVLCKPVERAAIAPSATLDSGVVVGTTTSLPSSKIIVNKFLGIPFAAPPVRFSPPVSPAKWSQPLDTSTYKPACVQQFNYPAAAREFTIELFDTPGPPAGESEDCLYINVYAPAGGKGKTVMFWIYGGALQFGSNSVIEYDGTSFAANQDVIIVAPNYRTNGTCFISRNWRMH